MVQDMTWARGTEGHWMTRNNWRYSSTAHNSYVGTQTSEEQQARECLLNKTQKCPRVTLYFLSDINQRGGWAVNCFQCFFIWILNTGTKTTLRHVSVSERHHTHAICKSWGMLHHSLYLETDYQFGPSKNSKLPILKLHTFNLAFPFPSCSLSAVPLKGKLQNKLRKSELKPLESGDSYSFGNWEKLGGLWWCLSRLRHENYVKQLKCLKLSLGF